MAYQADNIIVGAAAFYVAKGTIDGQAAGAEATATESADHTAVVGSYSAGSVVLPGFVRHDGLANDGRPYATTLDDTANAWGGTSGVDNIGYTTDGLELTLTPDIGDVVVDQVLDSARLFKQGMTASVKTTVAQATLQNLLYSLAGGDDDLNSGVLDLRAGGLGDCPTERGFVAIGPGTGDCTDQQERVYVGYRGMSTEAVTVSMKRDTPSQFDINLRLLPHTFTPSGLDPVQGSYGRIVDRDLSFN